jgi:hypothetical protein
MTAAAGITRVERDMKDRASRRENAIAIDRWEDEGGAGESPAKNSATPRSMPNHRDGIARTRSLRCQSAICNDCRTRRNALS